VEAGTNAIGETVRRYVDPRALTTPAANQLASLRTARELPEAFRTRPNAEYLKLSQK